MQAGAVTAEGKLGARCRSCRYPLGNLPEPRCPECGRRFDPDDPATVFLSTRPNPMLRWLIRPPTRAGRTIPHVATLCAAWGTRVPGWDSCYLIAAA